MAKTNTFEYVMEEELGKLGKDSVELGHYIMNGEQKSSNVYLVSRFKKRDGSNGIDGYSATKLCKANEAKALAEMLGKVGK